MGGLGHGNENLLVTIPRCVEGLVSDVSIVEIFSSTHACSVLDENKHIWFWGGLFPKESIASSKEDGEEKEKDAKDMVSSVKKTEFPKVLSETLKPIGNVFMSSVHIFALL